MKASPIFTLARSRTTRQLPGFSYGQAERLFAQNVLARLRRFDRPGHVQLVRQRIVDGINLRVSQQLLVGPIGLGEAERARCLLGPAQVPRRDRGDLAEFAFLHSRYDFLDSDSRGAQNSPAYFVSHIGT